MVEKNPLSNLSYTNKDFQEIYPELLNYVKNISYKWDPTISNESDPGVLLLKLCAIIADKNNYYIDKNVLECFPLSVTQTSNARQLFEQLGYNMHWYRSAMTQIALKWNGEIVTTNPNIYTIDRFTMVSDSKNNNVYTLTDQVNLTSDGKTAIATAIQGVAVDYTLNGETVITSSALDSYNRLYFTDSNVAENGIFIKNADGTSGTESTSNSDKEPTVAYGGWRKVDNLSVQELGHNYYRFGITQNTDNCYIEFPEDAEYLIGEGITITYIKSDGENGNIAPRVIEKFYSYVNATVNNDEAQKESLNTDNVRITNANSAVDGKEPETIDDAYRNYRKTIGTFNTLVSLRDYNNAINTSELVSNSFVCDRTNDVQTSYKVISSSQDLTRRVLQSEINQDTNEPYMDAFDLKLYALEYVTNPSNSSVEYNNSFSMLRNDVDGTDTAISAVKAHIEDLKSVQHDFQYLLRNKLCMIKNKYPIVCKIIPQYKVTPTQANAISDNIRKALYNQLNAGKVDFGEAVSYDTVYNTLINADDRIKAIVLDTLKFDTYAVFYNGNAYQEVLIDGADERICGYFFNGEFYEDSAHAQKLDAVNGGIYTDISDSSYANKSYQFNGTAYVEAMGVEFADDIYAKSVLNGNTQLFVQDKSFDYSIDQKVVDSVQNIDTITTNVSINMTSGLESGMETGSATYEFKPNEYLFLYAPSLIDEQKFSMYTKIQYNILNDISANSDYVLQANESVTFYVQTDSEGSLPYTYYKYGDGTILKPNFTMLKANNSEADYIGANLPLGKGTVPEQGIAGVCDNMNTYLSDKVIATKNVLSASKEVAIRKVDTINLNKEGNYCYWITNKRENGQYVLFDEGDTSRLLQSGELFIYTAGTSAELIILGTGTLIIRDKDSGKWAVDMVEATEIHDSGAQAIQNVWFKIPSDVTTTVVVTQYQSLGYTTSFTLKANKWQEDATYTATGTELKNTDTPDNLKLKAVDGVHYYNATMQKSWSVVKAHIDVTFNNKGTQVTSPTWNDGTAYTLSDFDMSYKDLSVDNSESVEIPPIITSTMTGWQGLSILNFKASATEPMVLRDNQTIDYHVFGEDSSIKHTLQSKNSQPLYILSDYPYDISGGTDVDVTRLNVDGETLYLNIYAYELSSSTDATITDDKIVFKFQATDADKDNVTWVEVDNDYTSIASAFIWSVDVLYNPTGIELFGEGTTPTTKNIEATSDSAHYYNATDSKSWTSVHEATEYTVSGDTPISKGLKAELDKTAFNSVDKKAWKALVTQTKSIDFNLPDGDYLLSMRNSSSFDSLNVFVELCNNNNVIGTINVSPVNNIGMYELTDAVIYYLDIHLNKAQYEKQYGAFDTYRLSLTAEVSTTEKTVSFTNTYKYGTPIIGETNLGENIYMSAEHFRAILQRVIALDPQKLYDYTYEVVDDELISNPILSESFFNSYHIYNKFTICQINTLRSSYTLTNTVR